MDFPRRNLRRMLLVYEFVRHFLDTHSCSGIVMHHQKITLKLTFRWFLQRGDNFGNTGNCIDADSVLLRLAYTVRTRRDY